MGVKDLWSILSPLSDRKPLFELEGKSIAIDLSCWVVDTQTVTNNAASPKLYLRNLFFRCSYFLLHNINPVFVLEGTAPDLKHKTIAKRNDNRYGGEKKKTKEGGKKRSQFNYVLRECEEMLGYLGLKCIKSHGEAEAMCAYLNQDGLVDGCISQDSDCFLYGAKVVYRNFCTNSSGNRATSNGSIDEYSMQKIEQVLNIGRSKMIALALLCGCDYDEGINGVGKEAALKLFKITEDYEILQRLKDWKTDPKFRRMESEITNPNICTNCGHPGKIRSHTRIGCVDCGTEVKCNDDYKEKKALISNELSIRKKALSYENFPNQELIDEFLIRKGPVPSKLDLQWRKPNIIRFIGFMEKNVQWDPAYGFAKIFPLMTRWQLLNLIELPLEQRLIESKVFIPEKVKKIRNIRGVRSYEILWIDKDNILEGLTLTFSDSEKDDNEEETPNVLSELATIEPQPLVLQCYPNIVEEFEILKNAKKKKPSTRKKKVPSLEDSFNKLNIISPKRAKKDRPRQIKKRGPQFKKIMTVERLDNILNGSLEAIFQELTPDDFPSEVEDDLEISSIVDNIINRNGTIVNSRQKRSYEKDNNISIGIESLLNGSDI